MDTDKEYETNFNDIDELIANDRISQNNSEIEKVYECKKCDLRFKTQTSFDIHNEAGLHNFYVKLYVCDVCGKGCKTKFQIHLHKRSHEIKFGKCPYCEKILKMNSNFKIHIRNHEANNETDLIGIYKCNDCSYKSTNKCSLEAHINKNHLHRRPYICEICDKGFYKNSNLVEHYSSHMSKNKMCCSICGTKFGNEKCFRDHLKLHTGEKPYKCDQCDETFVTAGRRSDHVKRKHLEKTQRCKVCNKLFSLRGTLNRHLKQVHKKKLNKK